MTSLCPRFYTRSGEERDSMNKRRTLRIINGVLAAYTFAGFVGHMGLAQLQPWAQTGPLMMSVWCGINKSPDRAVCSTESSHPPADVMNTAILKRLEAMEQRIVQLEAELLRKSAQVLADATQLPAGKPLFASLTNEAMSLI